MRRLLPLACLLLLLAGGAARAQAVRPLVVGAVEADSLGPDAVHAYALELGAGQFVYVEADQQTTDVTLAVFGPDGARVAGVDVTARGAEPFLFTTPAAGRYRLEVAPYNREAGRYAVTLRRVEPVATTPEGRVDQLMAAHTGDDRPGGVVAVIRGGEVAFVHAYGLADMAHGVPNTPETLFNLGSVSKQFAGIFFAMMAEEGRLSLDDDVRRYLPELPDFGPTVTLRHLLNHTSGYREVYGVLGMQGRNVDGDILQRQDAIDVVRYQPALQFPPGSRHLYNSTGYVLLTTIAERITGQSYPDWMDQHVFGPLGMTATHIEREPGEVIPGMAYSYTTTATGGWREDFEAYAYYGATDVHTNVYDLARWLRNFRTSELGGPGVMRRMRERSLLTNGDTLQYTLGLTFDDHLGLEMIQHDGATGGYRASLAYYPEIDAGVVVLANTGGVDIGGVALGTAEAFFAADARPEPPAPPPPTGVAVSAGALDTYAGAYWSEGAGAFAFTRDGGTLTMTTPSGRVAGLVALDDSTFWWTADRTLRFHRAASGPTQRAILHVRGMAELPLYRLTPPPADGGDLEGFAGRYFSEEVESFYTLAVADGGLTLTHRRLGTIPLRRQGMDLFTGRWPVSELTFERDAAGRVTGFRVFEGRSFGVTFRRVD